MKDISRTVRAWQLKTTQSKYKQPLHSEYISGQADITLGCCLSVIQYNRPNKFTVEWQGGSLFSFLPSACRCMSLCSPLSRSLQGLSVLACSGPSTFQGWRAGGSGGNGILCCCCNASYWTLVCMGDLEKLLAYPAAFPIHGGLCNTTHFDSVWATPNFRT